MSKSLQDYLVDGKAALVDSQARFRHGSNAWKRTIEYQNIIL